MLPNPRPSRFAKIRGRGTQTCTLVCVPVVVVSHSDFDPSIRCWKRSRTVVGRDPDVAWVGMRAPAECCCHSNHRICNHRTLRGNRSPHRAPGRTRRMRRYYHVHLLTGDGMPIQRGGDRSIMFFGPFTAYAISYIMVPAGAYCRGRYHEDSRVTGSNGIHRG